MNKSLKPINWDGGIAMINLNPSLLKINNK